MIACPAVETTRDAQLARSEKTVTGVVPTVIDVLDAIFELRFGKAASALPLANKMTKSAVATTAATMVCNFIVIFNLGLSLWVT